MTEAPELENRIAQLYIARPDVKAVQNTPETYMPVNKPWKRSDIKDHLTGNTTYGHYMVNHDQKVKLFALDLDILPGTGYLPTIPLGEADTDEFENSFLELDLRKEWADRRSPARSWMKAQMKNAANRLMLKIYNELGIQTACAYSGSKGLHIYGFTGLIPAADARDAAEIVLDMCDWRLYKGASRYHSHDQDPISGLPQYDIEVYPKQGEVDPGAYGSLMRLPLGRNKKAPKDPTFFLDPRLAASDWTPADSMWALTTDNPWRD